MTQSHRSAASGSKQAHLATAQRRLSYDETYICPVCRHGHISAIVLMDAFACNFCRHIFTVSLTEQTIRVEDNSQPMSWRWTGRMWQAANRSDVDLTWGLWIIGVALVILPPSLLWLSSHMFPPMPGSRWQWFPSLWVGLTFALHLVFVSWLLIEYYQLPFYVACKVRLRQWSRG